MAIPKYEFLFFVVMFKQFLGRKSLFTLTAFSIVCGLSIDYLLFIEFIFADISVKNGYIESSSPNFSMSCFE